MAFNISYKFTVDSAAGQRNIRKFKREVNKLKVSFIKLGLAGKKTFTGLAAGARKMRSSMLGLSIGIAAFGILSARTIHEFEKGMKRFKKLCQDDGFMMELRTRKHFIKPSIVKRQKKLEAIRLQKRNLKKE